MRKVLGGTLDKSGLVTLLGALFVAITLLTAALVYYAHSQLKWRAFHQYRSFAISVSNAIDASLSDAIVVEQERSVTQYRFYDTSKGARQRSALAQLRYAGEFSANLGYFQVDGDGLFSTPLLPQYESDTASTGLSALQLSQRRAVATDIVSILGSSSLIVIGTQLNAKAPGTAPAASPSPIELKRQKKSSNRSSVSALELDAELNDKSENFELRQRQSTAIEAESLEQSDFAIEADSVDESAAGSVQLESTPAESTLEEFPRVDTFNAALAPFEFTVLGSGHFILYRRVMVNSESMVQGMLLQKDQFLNAEIGKHFETFASTDWGRLVVALDQEVIAEYSKAPIATGDLLYQHQLAAPFGRLQLVYSLSRLPSGPAGGVLLWVSMALAAVLTVGFYILYRAGLKQLDLSRQQQSFVASVTHELKTPLTSIRMYGEMLQSGWVSDVKRQEYYQYIQEESERLSRLIANVLQLSNMGNESLVSELKTINAADLMAQTKSVVQTHLQRSNATVEYKLSRAVEPLLVNIDLDAWAQVVINLIDNAIKFSSQTDQCHISITIASNRSGGVCVYFRDNGPGIPRSQRQKIFDLFYRSDDDGVKQTAGSGIGLAIVKQLLEQMRAQIEVSSAADDVKQPAIANQADTHSGALFRVSFPQV